MFGGDGNDANEPQPRAAAARRRHNKESENDTVDAVCDSVTGPPHQFKLPLRSLQFSHRVSSKMGGESHRLLLLSLFHGFLSVIMFCQTSPSPSSPCD